MPTADQLKQAAKLQKALEKLEKDQAEETAAAPKVIARKYYEKRQTVLAKYTPEIITLCGIERGE